MLPLTLVIFSLPLVTANPAPEARPIPAPAPAFPRPRPNKPDSPSDDPDPNEYAPGGGGPGGFYSPELDYHGELAFPEPVVIENKLGRLEQKLKHADDEFDIGVELVNVIMKTQSATTSQDGDSLTGSPTRAPDVTATPTASLSITSYAHCTSYASILSSCDEATPYFYSLHPTQQASCACYSTGFPSSSLTCPTATTMLAEGTIPTLAIKRFDNEANECWYYLDKLGFESLAKAVLLPSGGVPGSNFCSRVNDELLRGVYPQPATTESISSTSNLRGNGTAVVTATSTSLASPQGLPSELAGETGTDCFLPPSPHDADTVASIAFSLKSYGSLALITFGVASTLLSLSIFA